MNREERKKNGAAIATGMAGEISQCRALVPCIDPTGPGGGYAVKGAMALYFLLLRVAAGKSDLIDALALAELLQCDTPCLEAEGVTAGAAMFKALVDDCP